MKTSLTTTTATPLLGDLRGLKTRQKATWESGDYGEVAKIIMPVAEEFVARLPLRPGMRVLDVACGSGNIAIAAARRGCLVEGIDIASNLIAQARARAAAEGLDIGFLEGDAEQLPHPTGEFDVVLTMFGAMFAARPEAVAAELFRVTRPGGFIAMANWTPEGFIGQMFEVFKRHLPPPPAGVPSVMLWGKEATVRDRLGMFGSLRLTRHIAAMRYPFPPAATVEFFRRYYGPTAKAFEMLPPEGQAALWRDLVELQAAHNTATTPNTTEALAEYLEVVAVRHRNQT